MFQLFYHNHPSACPPRVSRCDAKKCGVFEHGCGRHDGAFPLSALAYSARITASSGASSTARSRTGLCRSAASTTCPSDVISSATWQSGALRKRDSEWLATGDIAERNESGDLKFLGRKSEVIVTAAGVNIHPEDIEAAIEGQPNVAACAVVAMETPTGTEPCAVLACRGAGDCAPAAIEHANATLPEFQRITRWVLWPEPDLPRTSTGKVRRKQHERRPCIWAFVGLAAGAHRSDYRRGSSRRRR